MRCLVLDLGQTNRQLVAELLLWIVSKLALLLVVQ